VDEAVASIIDLQVMLDDTPRCLHFETPALEDLLLILRRRPDLEILVDY
jgi:hypothetical protein